MSLVDIDALRAENAKLKTQFITFAHRVRGAGQSIATTISAKGAKAGALEALALCSEAANVACELEMEVEQEKAVYDLGELVISDRPTDSELGNRSYREG